MEEEEAMDRLLQDGGGGREEAGAELHLPASANNAFSSLQGAPLFSRSAPRPLSHARHELILTRRVKTLLKEAAGKWES